MKIHDDARERFISLLPPSLPRATFFVAMIQMSALPRACFDARTAARARETCVMIHDDAARSVATA